MEAIIDNQFHIYVLLNRHFHTVDRIQITYSNCDYPQLYRYFQKKCINKESMLYKDDIQKCLLFIDSFSIVRYTKLPDSLLDTDIVINPQIYGNFSQTVPLNKRKDFIKNQSYGTLDIHL